MQLKDINNVIKQHNGKLYFVGGMVRDEILNIPSHDVDILITGLDKDVFEQLFPDAKMTGKSFPVYRMETEYGDTEFAFARKEIKISEGHNGFEMVFNKDITLKEDLYRRDLTMNALAKDVDTGEIIDYFNGIDNIHNKVIKAVSNHFLEDPLRALRTARFSSKFNFTIDNNTLELMNQCGEELKTMSQDRIVEELNKALQTDYPWLFFENLKKTNISEIVFPFYIESDVFKEVCNKTKSVPIRFAALMYYVDKDIIYKLNPAYSNEWKGIAGMISYLRSLDLDNLNNDEILNIFYLIKRKNLNIDDLKIVLFKFKIPYFNNNVFNIMNEKINIPKNMTGEEIKKLVYQERKKLLIQKIKED